VEQFDTSAAEFLAVAWENMLCHGSNSLAQDDGQHVYQMLTRRDGWHPDVTAENANTIGQYICRYFWFFRSLPALHESKCSMQLSALGEREPRFTNFTKAELLESMNDFRGRFPILTVEKPEDQGPDSLISFGQINIEQTHVRAAYGCEFNTKEKGIAQAEQRSVDLSGTQGFVQHAAAIKAEDEVVPAAFGSELLAPLGEPSPTEKDVLEAGWHLVTQQLLWLPTETFRWIDNLTKYDQGVPGMVPEEAPMLCLGKKRSPGIATQCPDPKSTGS
jgi:hypothetical protein